MSICCCIYLWCCIYLYGAVWDVYMVLYEISICCCMRYLYGALWDIYMVLYEISIWCCMRYLYGAVWDIYMVLYVYAAQLWHAYYSLHSLFMPAMHLDVAWRLLMRTNHVGVQALACPGSSSASLAHDSCACLSWSFMCMPLDHSWEASCACLLIIHVHASWCLLHEYMYSWIHIAW